MKKIAPHLLLRLTTRLLLLLVMFTGQQALAAPNIRYQQNIQGGATMIGNSFYLRSNDANVFTVQKADIDGDPSTLISSSADLVLPPGAILEKAYLSAETMYEEANTGSGGFASLKFKVPGGSYTTLSTASSNYLIQNSFSDAPGQPYNRLYRQIVFDVTSLIPSTATGTYTVADPNPTVATIYDYNQMGGWSLIMVYKNTSPSAQFRNVTVVDNWNFFNTAGEFVNVDIPNVTVPSSGTVKAVVGMTGTYGDPLLTDYIRIGQSGGALSVLTDPTTGLTNDALGGSIGWASTNNVSADGGPAISGNYTARNPNTGFSTPYSQAYGVTVTSAMYDSDIFDATGKIPASATPITVRMQQNSDGGDWLISGSYFVSVDLPAASLTKTMSPSTISTAGKTTYTFTIANTATGSVNLTGLGFTDSLPSALKVATPNGVTTTCTGATVSAPADGSTVTVSGISLNAGQTCAVTVDAVVKSGQFNTSCATNPAAFTNGSSNITATSGLLRNSVTAQCLIATIPDYSDSPSSYGSPSHTIVAGMYLGTNPPDAELAPATPLDGSGDDATGTDDEDGVSAFPTLTAGATSYSLPATNLSVTGSGTLYAWIDFNKDGAFTASEFTSVAVTSGTLAGPLNWSGIAVGSAGTTYARFRFTSDTLTDNAGTPTVDERATAIASNGEVEDYALTITASFPSPPQACVAAGVTPVADASTLPGNIYQLTADLQQQRGAVWGTSRADLSQPFDYQISLFLGDKDGGADGIAFVLQNDPRGSTSFGQEGIGIGWAEDPCITSGCSSDKGIEPAFAVEFDTYQNGSPANDPAADHIGIFVTRADGQSVNFHDGASNDLGLVSLASNIEDNAWHTARFVWNPYSQQFTTYFDGVLAKTVSVDLVAQLGTSTPFWGYTASTGSNTNQQLVCQTTTINNVPAMDLADTPADGSTAPDGSGTTAYGAPSHMIVPGIQLGATIDADATNIASTNAGGDGTDDDGVSIPALTAGQATTITVTVAGAGGYLQGWIDWNGDGDFADAGEQVATNLQDGGALDTNATAGTIAFAVNVPGTATTIPTFARFRWSTTTGLNSTAAASDGEVEDFQLTVSAAPINVPDVSQTCAVRDGSNYASGNPKLWWDVNTFAYPGNVEENTIPTLVTAPSTVSFGAGLTAIKTSNYWGISNVNATTASQARAYGEYLQVNFTTTATIASYLERWGTFSPIGAFPGIAIDIATQPDFSDAVNFYDGIYTGSDWHYFAGKGDQLLNAGTTYYVRAYFYGASSGGLDAFALQIGSCSDFGDIGIDSAAFHAQPAQQVLYLGTNKPDTEFKSQDAANGGANGTGDGADEDGITLPTLAQGQTATITANVIGAGGYLQGWIDFNGNGVFDASEQVATNIQDNLVGDTDNTLGTIKFNVTVPATAITTPTFARFRWSSTLGLNSTAAATDGEVEDYAVTINSLVSSCVAVPVTTLGSAYINSNNEYILTDDLNNLSGFIWSNDKIDLNQPFDIQLGVYLGSNVGINPSTGLDAGADGLSFILQNDPRGTAAEGQIGGFMGVDGDENLAQYGLTGKPAVLPSLTFEFDTFDNTPFSATGDIANDHTAIYLNGDVYIPDAANTLLPATSVGTGGEIEDGQYHITRYIWNPATKNLTYYFDGTQIASVTYDLIPYFGDSYVRFGFAAATGASKNLQKTCWLDAPAMVDPGYNLTGTIFEDINYGGGAGRDLTTSGGVGVTAARVELYDASGNLADTTTTAADGTYTFSNVLDGSYYVRVVTDTVNSTRTGTDGSEFGVQTFRTDGTTPVTGEVGGRNPAVADGAANSGAETLNTSTFALSGGGAVQSLQPVTVAGADISGIDVGFNFDTIVNTNDSGQGSLRQFILNSNLLGNTGLAQVGQTAGDEASIFMIPSAALTSGVARIAVNTALPNITASNTVITGLTQTTHIGDTNAGTVGLSQSIGVASCSTAVSPVNRPEVEIYDNASPGAILRGLTFAAGADNGAVNGIAIYGFGDGVDYLYGDIAVRANNITIENNIVAATAAGTDPGRTNGSLGNAIAIHDNNTNALVQNNYIAHFFRDGVLMYNGTSGNTVTGNQFRLEADWQTVVALYEEPSTAAVSVENANNNLIEGNYVTGGGYEAFELKQNSTGNTWQCNTAENLDVGSYRGNGFFLINGHSGSLITHNVVTGARTAVAATSRNGAGSNNTVSQNSFYANDALGIDLSTVNNSDGVTLNDANDADTGPNDLLNFPQFSQVLRIGGQLVIAGCAPAGSTIELFEADVSPTSASGVAAGANQLGKTQDYGEGETYLVSLVEGVGEDSIAGSPVDCATLVDADGNSALGMSPFQWTLPMPTGIALGDILTATATVSTTGTSEFSPAVMLVERYDHGDAPVSYGDAEHSLTPSGDVYLGTVTPDSETAAQPTLNADGDNTNGTNDEDGITLPTLTQGQTVTFTATVHGTGGYLQAWVDWNGNGDFADAGEQVALDLQDNVTGDTHLAAGQLAFTVSVPASATTSPTYARFRWSTTPGLGSSGTATDGEVEDYVLTIQSGGAQVSGRVFIDSNVDGVAASSEAGVSGLPVVLYDVTNGTCVSTRTNASGEYTFSGVQAGDYQVYEASRETVPVPQVCNPANAKDPAGYVSSTANASAAFTVAAADIGGLDFGDVPAPLFELDNSQTLLPGSSVVHPHRFTANSEGSVSFSITAETADPATLDWNSQWLIDSNCNGLLDGAEVVYTTPLAVTAGEQVCLLVKVLAPANGSAGATDTLTVSSSFTYGDGSLLTAANVQQHTDLTTLLASTTPTSPETPVGGEGKLSLVKSVWNVTRGSDGGVALPGETLQYTIRYENIGNGNVNELAIHDSVPEFTQLLGGSLDCTTELPAGLPACTTTTAPDGSLEWAWPAGQPLLPGAAGAVSYQVVVE